MTRCRYHWLKMRPIFLPLIGVNKERSVSFDSFVQGMKRRGLI